LLLIEITGSIQYGSTEPTSTTARNARCTLSSLGKRTGNRDQPVQLCPGQNKFAGNYWRFRMEPAMPEWSNPITLANDTDARRPRLLLVDDQPLLLHTLHPIFAGQYDVFMATTGPQALELCRRKSARPDPAGC